MTQRRMSDVPRAPAISDAEAMVRLARGETSALGIVYAMSVVRRRGTSTMVLVLYIFSALTKTSLPGIASAVSVLLFLVSLLLIVPLFAVRRRANEEAAQS